MDLENKKAPEGYRSVYDRTLLDEYLSMDKNGDCLISKNEWMIANILLLAKDMNYLEKKGADSIMGIIKDLSDEFDQCDKDGNKHMEFADFKKKLQSAFYIEED